jgi:hypothetical protein
MPTDLRVAQGVDGYKLWVLSHRTRAPPDPIPSHLSIKYVLTSLATARSRTKIFFFTLWNSKERQSAHKTGIVQRRVLQNTLMNFQVLEKWRGIASLLELFPTTQWLLREVHARAWALLNVLWIECVCCMWVLCTCNDVMMSLCLRKYDSGKTYGGVEGKHRTSLILTLDADVSLCPTVRAPRYPVIGP